MRASRPPLVRVLEGSVSIQNGKWNTTTLTPVNARTLQGRARKKHTFKKSININSNFYIAHYNLGILYKSIGKFEECKKCLKEAIRLHPQFYEAHRAFSQINKYKVNDNHIDVMKELYDKSNIDTSGKIALTFA